jgi:Skp family chaperone for outer membrane proteins
MKMNGTKTMMYLFPMLLLCASFTFAQAQQNLGIAVFDFQKTVEGSLEGKKAISQLQAKERAIRTELDKIENQILTFETKLNTQRLTLSLEAKQTLLFDIEKLKVKRARVDEDSTKEYQQLQFRLQSKIRDDVLAVVEKIAIEKEFSLVLDINTSGVAYFSQHFDITEDVIKQYNSSTSKK